MSETISKRFVIFIEPGKVPRTKGPFSTNEQVEKMLIEMRPHYGPSTKFIVAEMYGVNKFSDLWLEDPEEFLFQMKVGRMTEEELEKEFGD